KRFFKRLRQDESERRAERIQRWASEVPGTTRIAEARPREVARIAGVVEGLRVRPREGVPAVEALVGDGTGQITAVWLGRRQISGLMLGARVVLEGRLGGVPSRMQLMNPVTEFAPPENA
ncbi:MAG: OB-fold nucleic acid binding domain-containing protein, partial [Actinomycetota bacterium]